MEQKHDLRSNPVTEKHIKHEFLHGEVKEPIKMLNVFYAWKVIKWSPLSLKLVKQTRKIK